MHGPCSASPGAHRLLRAGERGWLVELGGHRSASVAAAIRARPWSDRLVEVVPATTTVLVTARDTADMPYLARALDQALAEHRCADVATADRTGVVEIETCYDGPDLPYVAETLGLSVAAVVRAHAEAEHAVAFFGFAPGFAYIDGLPAHLDMPRREEPRVRIEAGHVAIAGRQSVVYPGATPGGWHLIGHTDQRLWDPAQQPPNQLDVGDRVRFRAVGRTS